MMPVARSTRRTLLPPVSAMNRESQSSTATPMGALSCAAVAAPPSPALPAEPVPATVLIKPDE
jgi:hypothetical protein